MTITLRQHEHWRVISCASRYEVSDKGRVRRADTHKMLNGCKYANGYIVVRLVDNEGQRVRRLVHRLVAESFIPNPQHKRTVNHKNLNKIDNRLENLEWATDQENQLHCARIIHGNDREKPVLCVETGEIYPNSREACRRIGRSHAGVWAVLKGKWKTCGGFHWKFYNQEKGNLCQ